MHSFEVALHFVVHVCASACFIIFLSPAVGGFVFGQHIYGKGSDISPTFTSVHGSTAKAAAESTPMVATRNNGTCPEVCYAGS